MKETIKIICIEDSMDRICTGGKLIKKFECFELEHFEYNTSSDLILITNNIPPGIYEKKNFMLLSEYRKNKLKKLLNENK